jgi:hypothetical protein
VDSLYLLNCKSYERNKLEVICCKLKKEEIYSKHKKSRGFRKYEPECIQTLPLRRSIKRPIAYAAAVLYITPIFPRKYTVYTVIMMCPWCSQTPGDVYYHGCVRGTSQALELRCVRSLSVARCPSLIDGSWFDSTAGVLRFQLLLV